MLSQYNEIKEEITNPEILQNTLQKYGWYKQRNVWKNGIEKIIDNYGILRLNEKKYRRRIKS